MLKRHHKKIVTLIGALAPIFVSAQSLTESIDLYVFDEAKTEYYSICKAVKKDGQFITASHCLKESLYFKNNNSYDKLPQTKYVGKYSDEYFTGDDLALFGSKTLEKHSCGAMIHQLDSMRTCPVMEVDDVYVSLDCVLPRGYSGQGFLNADGQLCSIYAGYYDLKSGNDTLKVAIFNKITLKDNNNNE